LTLTTVLRYYGIMIEVGFLCLVPRTSTSPLIRYFSRKNTRPAPYIPMPEGRGFYGAFQINIDAIRQTKRCIVGKL